MHARNNDDILIRITLHATATACARGVRLRFTQQNMPGLVLLADCKLFYMKA